MVTFKPSVDLEHGAIAVSSGKRFLAHGDGAPFFYLGDTAWELFHRLTRDEADYYLRKRAEQRFTVIQAVALAELNGLTVPNANGDVPLIDLDPCTPNERYFAHVDYVVQRAGELGVFIGMLPTWASWTLQENHPFLENHAVFTPGNAYAYGLYLGRRYRHSPNIIWILGGDRAVKDAAHLEVFRQMARGLAEGDGGAHLKTFHPRGDRSSSDPLHEEPWLDFNMIQSGHCVRDKANHEMIRADYERTPVKPCLDGEPRYEDHPVMSPNWQWDKAQGYYDDYDVRKAAWWAVLAGAHGHTYGCHPVWQMWQPGREPVNNVRIPWYEALDLPGAWQMRHLRMLIESRPMLERMPDQSLLASAEWVPSRHVQASRAADGSYAFIYIPAARQDVTINMEKLAGATISVSWFNPRNGRIERSSPVAAGARTMHFTSPDTGPDWVLMLDDAARGFAHPGPGTPSWRWA
ncbi:DUF4038 domain-containing protein [bacterium]|nr:DUF4038 domain-containing protein [bacterium]